MDWDQWGPAIIASISATGIGGILIKSLVESSTKHVFDRQIESLKSDLRNSESELASVRATVLSGFASRNQEMNTRRLRAAERLWSATMSLRQFGMAVTITRFIKMEAVNDAFKRAGSDADGLKKFADNLWETQGFEKFGKNSEDLFVERLFVTPKAWLAYEVISGVVARAILALGVMRTGIPMEEVMKSGAETNKLILNVLPHQENYLKLYPENGGYFLIKELEEVIFLELTALLGGLSHDLEAVKQVSDVLKATSSPLPADVPDEIPPSLRADPVPMMP